MGRWASTMRIGDLARRANVTKDTIRHYVAIGLLDAMKDQENGYQIFNEQALSRLLFVKTARQLGLGLEDIQAIFADAENHHSPCPRVRDLIANRIIETRKTINNLTRLCDHLEASMATWQQMPDGEPDGHSICHLIESQINTYPSDQSSDSLHQRGPKP